MGDVVSIPVESGDVQGYLAAPPQPAPGVLVLHAWWGLNDFFRRSADRLAEAGFLVLAPDLYGGQVATTAEEAQPLMRSVSPEPGIRYVEVALDYLLHHPQRIGDLVGAWGVSVGAAYGALLASRRPEIGAVVLIVGGAGQEEDFAQRTQAAFQGHFSEEDAPEEQESLQELEVGLRAAGREVELTLYPGTRHHIIEDDLPEEYNRDAAEQVWERSIAFLHRTLDAPA
jgi:carboxymethylenebutenolidase